MRKILTLLIFISVAQISEAQFIPKKWAVISIDKEKIIYIDTTSIKERDRQLIVWSYEALNVPQKMNQLEKKVARIKSQYLFNTLSNKFTKIGVLYYDDLGQIAGETFNQNATGSGEVFSLPVENNPTALIILESAQRYLNENSLGEVDSTIAQADLPDSTDEGLQPEESSTEKPIPENVDSVIADGAVDPDEIIKARDNKDSSETAGNKEKKVVIRPIVKPQFNDTLVLVKAKPQIDSSKIVKEAEPEIIYNSAKEKNVTSTIFTDGKLFVVQVSSWKNNKIAESEKQKLIRLGYNAFIEHVFIKRKGSNWNRVRVGYFNSLSEAKKYRREISRKMR